MMEPLKITRQAENGILVLTIEYDPEALLRGTRVSKELLPQYQKKVRGG